ncbi:MAG: DUF4397 domain-containing protein [Thermomicrobiales bacterium]
MPQLLKSGLTKLRLISIVALVGALAVVLVGGISAQEGDSAMVRVVHASPDAPAVDVLVDGEAAFEGLEFSNATDYAELSAGEHQFQVVPAGGEAADAVIDTTATVESGTSYSIVAVGALSDIQPMVVTDDISQPDEGMAHIKVVHTVPGAPAVDVGVTDGPVLFENVEFMQATEYMPVEAGTYDLQVTATGAEDVVTEAAGVQLEAGTVYSAYAMPDPDNTAMIVPVVDQTFETGGEATPTEAAEGTPTEAAGATGTASPEASATIGAEGTATQPSTATQAPGAQATATGTGGGDVPTMPGTGAGGTADGSDSTLMWIIGAASAFLLAVGGGVFAWSRRTA